MNCCPHCHQPLQADPLMDAVEQLRAACDRRGLHRTFDDHVTERDAADLLNVSAFTLRNRRLQDQPIPYRKLTRTPTYALRDLAEYLLKQFE